MINGTIVAIIGAVIICLIVIMIITIFVSQDRYKTNEQIQLLSGALGQSCYYNPCANSLTCETSSFTCKYNIANPCDQGSDCYSRRCVSGICGRGGSNPPAPGQVGTPCPCTGDILTCNTLGSASQSWCLYVDGKTCTSNLDCNSFNCQSGTCQAGTPNGYPCAATSDCQSANCSNGICQPTGVTTGDEDSYCVTDLYGGGENYVTSSCGTGLSCTGTVSNLEAGTCKGLSNFMETCTQASDCSTQFDCTTSYSGGTGTYCLLHYDNPMDVAINKTCPSPFTPKASSDLISCLGITNSPCRANGDCASNSCVANNNSISESIVQSLDNLKGSFSLSTIDHHITNNSVSDMTLLNYPYGSTGAYILYYSSDSEDPPTQQIYLVLQNISSSSSNFSYSIANNNGLYSININFGGIYQNKLLCLCTVNYTYQSNTNIIFEIPLTTQNFQITLNNASTQDGSYNEFYIDTSGTTTNYIITKEGSILTGLLTLSNSSTLSPATGYGNLTSVYSTGYIYSGPKAISVINNIPYVFYSINDGLTIINVTTNTPITITFNSQQYPFTLYNFSPYFANNMIGVYGVITNSENVSFTSLIDIWDSQQNERSVNTWNMPGNVDTDTQVFVTGNTLTYLPTNICT